MRTVNHKHEDFGVSLHNRYSALAKLNRDTKVADSAVCGDDDHSIEQGIVVH